MYFFLFEYTHDIPAFLITLTEMPALPWDILKVIVRKVKCWRTLRSLRVTSRRIYYILCDIWVLYHGSTDSWWEYNGIKHGPQWKFYFETICDSSRDSFHGAIPHAALDVKSDSTTCNSTTCDSVTCESCDDSSDDITPDESIFDNGIRRTTLCSLTLWQDGKMLGWYKSWHINGMMREKTMMRNNKKHGQTTHWYPNGDIESEGWCQNGYLRRGYYLPRAQ